MKRNSELDAAIARVATQAQSRGGVVLNSRAERDAEALTRVIVDQGMSAEAVGRRIRQLEEDLNHARGSATMLGAILSAILTGAESSLPGNQTLLRLSDEQLQAGTLRRTVITPDGHNGVEIVLEAAAAEAIIPNVQEDTC